MGWSIGYDRRWKRDIGYGVPATCDHPGCGAKIDRGLSFVCCNVQPGGGEHGCGLFFCGDHADPDGKCERCRADAEPFEPTPDVAEWIAWKLTDEIWAGWRAANPDEVAKLKAQRG